jgi:hypothetical protein
MNKENTGQTEEKSQTQKTVETHYKKVMRVLEYYVLACFILVTFVPLLNFGWTQGFVKFIYFTGFPLLILIFIIGLFKNPIQDLFTRLLEKS